MVLQIYFDGSCQLCRTSARFLGRIDWFENVILIDLHQPGVLKKAGISYQDALYRIQVMSDEGKHYEGISALKIISQAIPLLWLLLPFLWISEKIGIGNKMYDWVARHRFIFPIPGYCQIDD